MSENKNIVVEIEDGIIQAVYCPNDGHSYEIHIVYRDDDSFDSVTHTQRETLKNYFDSVEKMLPNLINFY